MGSSGKRPKRPSKKRSDLVAGKTSGKEIEVKLRIGDRAAILRRFTKLRARLIVDRVHEMNTLYDTAEGALAAQGQLVRIRVERPAGGASGSRKKASGKASKVRMADPAAKERALLTFKGPAESPFGGTDSSGRYKIREEQESHVEDPVEMAKVFGAMGLVPWFRYEKYRSTYRLPCIPDAKVELDETPVGDFLEIEGSTAAIDRVAKQLGFRRADYITKSYGALFMEQRGMSDALGSEPNPVDGVPDMLFHPKS